MSGDRTDPPSTDGRLDAVFEALSHPYRRHILLALAGASSPEVRRDPLTLVAADVDPDTLAIHLYHNHLPKLDGFGFVDWDRESETVARGHRIADVEPLLALLDHNRGALPYDWP
jgi:hypothetical protein